MRRIITGSIVALVLVAAMVAPTVAWSATTTCDHITLGKVPVGVSAILTPGPITISPPNKATSINGTYEVPPATYLITFSDGSVIHDMTVPVCSSPSARPSSSPSSGPSSSPSARPSSSPSSGPSSSPSAAPSSNGTPGASPSGSGGILGATATPRTTAPSTDALADPSSNGLGASLPLLVFFLVGINIGLILILRTPSRPHRRGHRG